MIHPEHEQIRLGRRDFLRVIGFTLAASTISGDRRVSSDQQVENGFREKFKKAYLTYKNLRDTFGVCLSSDVPDPNHNLSNPDRNIWLYMENIFTDKPHSNESTMRFSLGWLPDTKEEDINDLQRKATDKIKKYMITHGEYQSTIMLYPHLYDALQQLGKVIPLEFVYGVDNIVLVPSSSEGFAFYGIDPKTFKGTLFVTPTFLEGRLTEGEVIALIHELSHPEGTFMNSPHNAKQYVHEGVYATFLSTKADSVREIVERYFTLPWSEEAENDHPQAFAKTFKYGGQIVEYPLQTTDNTGERIIPYYDIPLNETHITRILLDNASGKANTTEVAQGKFISYITLKQFEESIKREYTLNLSDYNYEDLSYATQTTVDYMMAHRQDHPDWSRSALQYLTSKLTQRLNEILHQAGNIMVKTKGNSAIKNDIHINALMRRLFGDLEHFLVGPVQFSDSVEGNQHLSSKTNPTLDEEQLFTKINRKMQTARLRLIAAGLGEKRFTMTSDEILDSLAQAVSPIFK